MSTRGTHRTESGPRADDSPTGTRRARGAASTPATLEAALDAALGAMSTNGTLHPTSDTPATDLIDVPTSSPLEIRLAELLDPVLLATRSEVSAYGVRRATMTSVARRAGISRATLYRRATSFDQLVQDALVAEFEAMLEVALEAPPDAPMSRSHIVDAARTMLEQLAESTFASAIIEHDPELLLPYLVDRLGRSQEGLLDGLEAAIGIAQSGGTVRQGPARILALACLQALTPYVVSLRVMEQVAPQDVWFDEAAHLIDAYLRPTRAPGPAEETVA